MARRNRWDIGGHLVFCDRCGATYPDSLIRKEWTGLLVCDGPGTRGCYEERNPIDFTRGRSEDFSVQGARPRNVSQDVIHAAGYAADGYVENGYWNYEFA